MDFFAQLDAPVFSRFVFCLRQREALKLAAVASTWPDSVAAHFRKLLIAPTTPMAAASAAVDSFNRLREVVVDGGRGFREPQLWEAAALLLRRLLEKPLESLTLRSLTLQGSLVERRAQMQFLQAALERLPSCPSLQQITFDNVSLDEEDAALQWLAKSLQKLAPESALTVLGFNGCNVGPKGVVACLAIADGLNAGCLTELNLSMNLIGEEGAALLSVSLPKLCKLRVLTLAGNGLGPAGARALSSGLRAISATLEQLDLSLNGLEAEGVAALVPASLQLRWLCLAGSWIAPEGVDALLQLIQPMTPHLTHLDLAHNKLNAEGTCLLLERLPCMPQLRSLNLAENYFATRDFLNTPLNRLAECAPLLEELNLKANSLGSDDMAVREIASHLPSTLVSLHLGVAQLKAPQLQVLIDALPALPRLEDLSFAVARLDDDAVDILASTAFLEKLPELQYLDLCGNAISMPALKRLIAVLRRSPTFKQVKTTGREHLLSSKKK